MVMAGTGPQEEAMDSSDNNYKVPVQVSRRVSLRRRVLEYNLVQLQARQLAMQERDIQIRNNYERLRTSRQNLIAACDDDDEDDDNEDGDNEASDIETDKHRHRRRSKRHAKASGFFRTLTKKLRHADCSSGGHTRRGGEYENKQTDQGFKMAAPNCEVPMDERSATTSYEMSGLVRSQAVMNLASQLQNLRNSSTSVDELSSPTRLNKENETSDSDDVEMDFTSTASPLPAHSHSNPPQRSSSLCLTQKSKPCKITKHRSLRFPSMLRCKPRVYDHVTAEISPPPSKKGKHEPSLSAPEHVCSGNGKSYSVPAAPLPRRRALSVKFTPVQWKDIS